MNKKPSDFTIDSSQIRTRRLAIPYSQHELALKAGVNLNTIKGIESSPNGKGVRALTVRKLAEVFKVQPNELLLDNSERKAS